MKTVQNISSGYKIEHKPCHVKSSMIIMKCLSTYCIYSTLRSYISIYCENRTQIKFIYSTNKIITVPLFSWQIPLFFKSSYMVPMFKDGNTIQSPIIVKVFESIVLDRLQLIFYSALIPEHGFTAASSTNTILESSCI